MASRVIAIADAYDTITSARSYKKPRTPEDAFSELHAAPRASSIRKLWAYLSRR